MALCELRVSTIYKWTSRSLNLYRPLNRLFLVKFISRVHSYYVTKLVTFTSRWHLNFMWLMFKLQAPFDKQYTWRLAINKRYGILTNAFDISIATIPVKYSLSWLWRPFLFIGMLDSFTVPLHSPNGRHLPAVRAVLAPGNPTLWLRNWPVRARAVQSNCHWGVENGGNSHRSRQPITQ